jgi:hypothetical protein
MLLVFVQYIPGSFFLRIFSDVLSVFIRILLAPTEAAVPITKSIQGLEQVLGDSKKNRTFRSSGK